MAVSYRTPTPADARALTQLGRETYQTTFAYVPYPAADLAAFLATSYDPLRWTNELADPDYRWQIAEVDSELVGYIRLGLRPTLDYATGGRRVIELKQLYLHAEWQGHGIGQQLMAWAIEQARELAAELILLSVFNENYHAQQFYQRHGFIHVANSQFLVGTHVDHEFIYALDLTKLA
jgi:diamine N-acetyltransferase